MMEKSGISLKDWNRKNRGKNIDQKQFVNFVI